MLYHPFSYVHLATVLPALVLGGAILVKTKGTHIHRQLGRWYMVLMLFTALITLFMSAGDRAIVGHFGGLHLFCLFVLYAVPTAFLAIRRGDVGKHRRAMILLYTGTVIAGVFAFSPGRLLHQWFLS